MSNFKSVLELSITSILITAITHYDIAHDLISPKYYLL